MVTINGWEFNEKDLPCWDNRESIPYVFDNLFESENSDSACLIYSIAEVGMGRLYGFISIYKNKAKPVLIFNTTTFNFSGSKDAVNFDKSGNLIFAKALMYFEKENKQEFPILIFNLVNKEFAYIPIINGIHYSIEEICPTKFMLVDKYFDERFKTRNGEIIDLEKLEYYSIEDINSLPDKYFLKEEISIFKRVGKFFSRI